MGSIPLSVGGSWQPDVYSLNLGRDLGVPLLYTLTHTQHETGLSATPSVPPKSRPAENAQSRPFACLIGRAVSGRSLDPSAKLQL